MLIAFTVENFRSIHAPVTLDLQINSFIKEVPENTISVNLKGVKDLQKCLIIYGINGSGKSNILAAIDFARDFILYSHQKTDGDIIDVEPFLLSDNSFEQPSVFKFEFIFEGQRFNYEFSVTQQKVIFERLIAYPAEAKQTWFKRKFIAARDDYEWSFGSAFKGEKEATRNTTLENTLFFSKSVQDNNEQTKPLRKYFLDKLNILFDVGDTHSTKKLLSSPNGREKVLALFRGADLGIDDIFVDSEEFDEKKLPDFFPEDVANLIKADPVLRMKAKSVHKIPNSEKSVIFDFLKQESFGAKKLFGYAALLIHIREFGGTLIIDELENNLHIKLFDYIVKLFQPGDKRLPNAQIIFTTHNPLILKENKFRRDQLIFAIKDKILKSTEVYNLSRSHKYSDEFKQVRKGSDFLIGYLDGKYYLPPKMDPQIVFDFIADKKD